MNKLTPSPTGDDLYGIISEVPLMIRNTVGIIITTLIIGAVVAVVAATVFPEHRKRG